MRPAGMARAPFKYLAIPPRECEFIHSSQTKKSAEYFPCRHERHPGATATAIRVSACEALAHLQQIKHRLTAENPAE
jgi:hypothetical protein